MKAASHPPSHPDLPPILVVDDEEAVLCSLRDTLSREGYRVVTAPGAGEALVRLGDGPFSVVISDQRMPGLTGLEFLSRVRQLHPGATRILITGVVSLEVVIDAINKGEIYRFVVKPWLREELLVTVRNAAQRFASTRRQAALEASLLESSARLAEAQLRIDAEAGQAAGRNRQIESLQAALEQSRQHPLELCLKVMDTFHPPLGNQARRIRELCQSMAAALGLEPAERATLESSAWLHDLGLVGVPRRLLRQWESAPESLAAAERALLERHPAVGQQLVESGPLRQEAGRVIRAHHENLDGSGYPDGLRGDEIPWLARLLAVAAAYSGSGRDSESTMAALEELSGRIFDPEAVRVLRRCLPGARLPRHEREVPLTDLRPGMVVARGIYNAHGLLLVPDGRPLTASTIDELNDPDRRSPGTRSLMIYR